MLSVLIVEGMSVVVNVMLSLMSVAFTVAFTAGPVCLFGVSSPVVVLGLFVRLSQYPMLCVRLLR